MIDLDALRKENEERANFLLSDTHPYVPRSRLQRAIQNVDTLIAEVERLTAENEQCRVEVDAIALCTMCGQVESKCQCIHPDTSTWETPLAKVERLKAELAAAQAKIERVKGIKEIPHVANEPFTQGYHRGYNAALADARKAVECRT